MTERESFFATLAHEPHEGVLHYASFTPDLERRAREYFGVPEEEDIRDALGMYNPVMTEPEPPGSFAPPDFSEYFADVHIPEGAFVNHLGVLEIPSGLFHLTGYVSPLRNARTLHDLERFPWPEVWGYSADRMTVEAASARALGKVVGCWIGHMYEDAWQIRGYEEFLSDMVERPEWCAFILDRIMERNLAMVRFAGAAGVDWIKTGDDVAGQRGMIFSPEMWRAFMKPRWAEVFSLSRDLLPDAAIWYHSDGDIGEVIPELIDIGISILNPVQPECLDPVEVKRRYDGKLVLEGTIGTQSTMPFANPEGVRNVVRERIETLGGDGALILSPTHVLEPEVPLANIRVFLETARGG